MAAIEGTVALERTKALVPLLLALVGALLALCLAHPSSASAATACGMWGDTKPKHLKTSEARRAVMCLVNRARKRSGRGHLHRDGRLAKAAQRHTRYMRKHRCFSHQCAGEATLAGRLYDVGYLSNHLSRWACGENIAWGMRGKATPRATVKAWMHSAGHRANILSGTFHDANVGFVKGTPSGGGSSGAIYTMDFGLRSG